MNSLSAPAATDATDANVTSSRGERLDHTAEDEATLHWVKQPKQPSNDTNSAARLLLPTNHSLNDKRDESKDDDSGMMSHFVRAGEKRKYSSQDNSYYKNEDGNEIIDDYENDEQVNPKQSSEITPLEKQTSNHNNNKKLPPIHKIIHPPQTTQSSTQWRQQHSITCNPPIDPILSFDPSIFSLPLVKKIAQQGLDSLTLVQCQTLGVVLGGRDGVVTAKTGSGKSELLLLFCAIAAFYFVIGMRCAALCFVFLL